MNRLCRGAGPLPVWLLLSIGLGVTLSPHSAAGWTTQVYGPHTLWVTLNTADVQESSGLVASGRNADVLWTHNDSGSSGPRFWAMRVAPADVQAGVAACLGYVELTGATNQDWEDISAGPGGTLYAFDGGDNPPCDRSNKRIHRFMEPVIDPQGPRFTLSSNYQSIRFEYPDSTNRSAPADENSERYDAECLMVHPVTGDIYVVTKRDTNDVGAAKLYKLPAGSIRWDSAQIHVLQPMADLTGILGVSANVVSTVTGGDIDAAGQRVLIRRYGFAFEFTLPSGLPFDAVFRQKPVSIELAGEVQGEGICYAAGQGDILATSEVRFVGGMPLGPSRCPIFRIPWRMANAQVNPITPRHAVIRWDTSTPLASHVDCGTTTSYGWSADDPAVVLTHAMNVPGLAPGTRYYYRVTSGSLGYPPVAGAAQVFFMTPEVSPSSQAASQLPTSRPTSTPSDPCK